QRVEAVPVDRAVRGVGQQHRRHAEDRATGPEDRRRGHVGSPRATNASSCARTDAGTSGARSGSTARASCDAPTAQANQCRPGGTVIASAGTIVCGAMTLALGLNAITWARRAGLSVTGRSTIVDAPHGDVAWARPPSGVSGAGGAKPSGSHG